MDCGDFALIVAICLFGIVADRPSPSAAVIAAAADVQRLDSDTAKSTRYHYAGHMSADDRAECYAVLSYHVNSISRESTIVRPRRVNDWLWAIDIRDYGWSPEVYGALGYAESTVEPYFHVEPLDGKGNPTRPQIPAPWLPPIEMAELLQRTGSTIPIVRADWFIHRTAIQEGRNGHGYYDFLEFKSRADAEKLAGLDRAKAISIYREQAAIVPVSGVTLQGRQLFRYSTIAGSWWESRDTKADKDSRGARNPQRQLLEDYKHDAEEIVFTLPNRLPGFYLSDSAGKQIDSAPPDIASDHKSTSNDRRVHPGLSCIRCHEAGGLRPFDDHARRLYSADGGIALGSTDAVKFRRLRSVYLGNIDRNYKSDVDSFAEAVKEASGLTHLELSKAIARQWARYADESVSPSRLAEEIGVTEDELIGSLKGMTIVDPVIAGLIAKPPIPIRREQIEEFFPLLMNHMEKQ